MNGSEAELSVQVRLTPFRPGRPISGGLFVGRAAERAQLQDSIARALKDDFSAHFVVGNRGIGKSSLCQSVIEDARSKGACCVHLFLGQAGSELRDCLTYALRSIEQELPAPSTRWKRALGRIGMVQVASTGISLLPSEDGACVRSFKSGLVSLLQPLRRQGRSLFLVLDEIGALARGEQFAAWLKSFIDSVQVVVEQHKPEFHLKRLVLVVCATDQERDALARSHPSLNRTLRVIAMSPLNMSERISFFSRGFEAAGVAADPAIVERLAKHATGNPTIMQEIGEALVQHVMAGGSRRITGDVLTSVLLGEAERLSTVLVPVDQRIGARVRKHRSWLLRFAQLDTNEFSIDSLRLQSALEYHQAAEALNHFQHFGIVQQSRRVGDVQLYRFSSELAQILFVFQGSVEELLALTARSP